MQISLKMADEEFEAFRRSVITPMFQRHQMLFAKTHRRGSTDVSNSGPGHRTGPTLKTTAEENPKTERYEPCPCNSGLKFKFYCCKKVEANNPVRGALLLQVGFVIDSIESCGKHPPSKLGGIVVTAAQLP